MITQSELKSLLSYNEDTGIFRWLEARGGRSVGSIAGSLRKDGYIEIRINRTLYLAHRLAWLYVSGEFPPEYIDHDNMIRGDNRIINLREASNTQNQYNQGKHSNNPSGFKGVRQVKSGKWTARCVVNGKEHYLGLHLTPEEAYAAYCAFAKLHHGEFYHSGDQK